MYEGKMPERKRVVDGRGRVWTVAKVAWEDAEAEGATAPEGDVPF